MMPGRTNEGRAGWRGAASSLELPQYRWLFASNMAFFFAMNAQSIVRSWLAFKLTDSELALGTVMFVVAVPMLIIAPYAGVIADRHDRRTLIMTGQAVVVVNEAILFALLASGKLAFWHLVAGAGVMGCVFPFIMPARQALVANLVGRQQLQNAMALSMMGMNATRVIGPAGAGFLLASVGEVATYAVGVTLYAVAVTCMLPVHAPVVEARDRTISVGQNLREGVHYVRDHRLVLVLLFFGLVPMFLAMPFQSLLVVFADRVWDVGGHGLGLLSGAAGIGGVIGSIYVAWHSQRANRLGPMLVSVAAFSILLVGFALSPWFLLAIPLVLAANIFASIFSTLNNTAIQLIIPDHVRGRISSFLMMSFSLPLLGTLPMSAVAELYGARVAVTLAAGLALLAALAFYLASPALRRLDEHVEKSLTQPEVPS